MANVSANAGLSTVRILIDDVPHIHIPRRAFRGMQSWLSMREGQFSIEISLEGAEPMLLEYGDRCIWEAVLRALDGSFY